MSHSALCLLLLCIIADGEHVLVICCCLSMIMPINIPTGYQAGGTWGSNPTFLKDTGSQLLVPILHGKPSEGHVINSCLIVGALLKESGPHERVLKGHLSTLGLLELRQPLLKSIEGDSETSSERAALAPPWPLLIPILDPVRCGI